MVIATLQSRSKVVGFLKRDVPPYRASRRRGNTSLVPMICRISSIDSRICLLCHLCLLAVLRSKYIFLRAKRSRYPDFGCPGDHFFDLFWHSGRSILECFSMPGQSFSSPEAHLDDFWSHCQIFLKKVSSPTPPKEVDFGTFFDPFFHRFLECSHF